MRRGYGPSVVTERPGSLELRESKSFNNPTIPLHDEVVHNVRSVLMKRMPNTNWPSRQANIKKRKTGRSDKVEMESLRMRIWPKL